MNYSKIYGLLTLGIQTKRNIISKEFKDKYNVQKHHIYPKCFEKINESWNLVNLTYREHQLAHHLLTKMYPNHKGIKIAYDMMKNGRGKGGEPWNRGKVWSQEVKDKISKAKKGKKMSITARINISEGHKGITSGMLNKQHSDLTKYKMSIIKTGKVQTKETRERISKSNKGKITSEETKRKLSESHKGKPAWNKGIHMTLEQKKASSLAHKGQKAWNKGISMLEYNNKGVI